MTMETWRDIPGWEGYYQASSIGRIRSLPRHNIRAVRLDRYGYYRLNLSKGSTRKTVPVHVLVALAFRGTPQPGQEVRHLNGVHADNRASNLYWGTRKENDHDAIAHGTKPRGENHWKSKLDEDDVIAIRSDPRSQPVIGREYGVTHSTIGRIKRRQNWQHVT